MMKRSFTSFKLYSFFCFYLLTHMMTRSRLFIGRDFQEASRRRPHTVFVADCVQTARSEVSNIRNSTRLLYCLFDVQPLCLSTSVQGSGRQGFLGPDSSSRQHLRRPTSRSTSQDLEHAQSDVTSEQIPKVLRELTDVTQFDLRVHRRALDKTRNASEDRDFC